MARCWARCSGQFPNYSAGVSLTVPCGNRSAQADLITDQLNYRQTAAPGQAAPQQHQLNVINAKTRVRQARAAWGDQRGGPQMQEQTLAGTQRKYELGTSTISTW